jgi:hypothetical protein
MSSIGCVDFLTLCESILLLAIGVHVLLVFIFSVGCLITTGYFLVSFVTWFFFIFFLMLFTLRGEAQKAKLIVYCLTQ